MLGEKFYVTIESVEMERLVEALAQKIEPSKTIEIGIILRFDGTELLCK